MSSQPPARPALLAVCHDAGAAALLWALVRQFRDAYAWRLLSVPGAPAWESAIQQGLGELLQDLDAIGDLDATLDQLQPRLLLYGTGWQRRLQRPLIAYARSRGIPSLALLDHWGRYRERFGYPEPGWEEQLPDQILVTDPQALATARALGLPRLLCLRNYHYAQLLEEAQGWRQRLPQEDRLLVLSEPTSRVAAAHFGTPDHWAGGEARWFRGVLEQFPQLGLTSLTLRLHPADSPQGYDAIAADYPQIPIEIETPAQSPLTANLVRARLVLGLDTFALYVAYLLGLPAVSWLPWLERSCHVPIPRSNCLRSLEALQPDTLERLDDPTPLLGFGMEFPELLRRVLARP
jgi:hypothetical protein